MMLWACFMACYWCLHLWLATKAVAQGLIGDWQDSLEKWWHEAILDSFDDSQIVD